MAKHFNLEHDGTAAGALKAIKQKFGNNLKKPFKKYSIDAINEYGQLAKEARKKGIFFESSLGLWQVHTNTFKSTWGISEAELKRRFPTEEAYRNHVQNPQTQVETHLKMVLAGVNSVKRAVKQRGVEWDGLTKQQKGALISLVWNRGAGGARKYITNNGVEKALNQYYSAKHSRNRRGFQALIAGHNKATGETGAKYRPGSKSEKIFTALENQARIHAKMPTKKTKPKTLKSAPINENKKKVIKVRMKK